MNTPTHIVTIAMERSAQFAAAVNEAHRHAFSRRISETFGIGTETTLRNSGFLPSVLGKTLLRTAEY